MATNGGYTLWITDNLLHASIHGVWNKRIATAFKRDFMETASTLINAPWAHVVYLDKWVLGTPEIEPLIKELGVWCAEHQLVCAAHIYCHNMLKEYQLNKMLKNDDNLFQLQHFTSQEAAQQWLRSNNFYFTEQDFPAISNS
ncbi:MAG: hypothetical protein HWE26_18865 [Alteromonadaceae bacterium]|nr:hypothetical protein [Alteromonadaceae bacterium]